MLVEDNTKILSVSEVAQLIHFSQFRVKKLITDGEIKARKIRGRYLIAAKSVNDWHKSLLDNQANVA